MTPKTLKNITLALCMALLLCIGHLLDGPSEIEAAQAVAADVQDAIQTAQVSQ